MPTPDDNRLPAPHTGGHDHRTGSDSHRRPSTNEAAANLARNQINSLFGEEVTRAPLKSGSTSSERTIQPISAAPAAEQKPLEQKSVNQSSVQAQAQPTQSQSQAQTQSPSQPNTDIQSDQWKQYHTAWQQYYQQYYYRQYASELEKKTKDIKQSASSSAPAKPAGTLSEEEAISDLRAQLRNKMKNSAQKARKSKHFIPIMAGLSVMLLFAFLQYNSLIFANVNAYVSPGNLQPANVIVEADPTLKVGPEPKIIIPKINVEAPIVFNVSNAHDEQMKALESGVAHLTVPGASSLPGQVGNTVIYGHSSNDVLERGGYNFVFVRLEKLQTGDAIIVNYNGVRYTYSVTKMEVVKPTDVSKLVYQGDKPILTLITCTPIGTDISRLLVTAEQISPDPKGATPAAQTTAATATTDSSAGMPSGAGSFFDKLFHLGQN